MLVDFHSHILPQIDDGSSSIEESAAMLQYAARQGIHEFVLTPHFYPNRSTPNRFLEKRDAAFKRLCEHLEPEYEVSKFHLGAEVKFYPQMSYSDLLCELAIDGTAYILVEMPFGRWTDSMYRELESINGNLGLTPIIAHVDRYLGRFFDHGIPNCLSQLPVLVQANADFFLNKATSAKAINMLKKHQIHLLGSDCHNMSGRKPKLGEAADLVVQRLGEGVIEWINQNEREILKAGEP